MFLVRRSAAKRVRHDVSIHCCVTLARLSATPRCASSLQHNVRYNKLDGWQLSGRIAPRATRRELPSRQYGLRACGDAG